jgi:chromosome segregation ATPase
MRSGRRWLVGVFALVTLGCAPLTSQSLLNLSEREGQFYRKLKPALIEAKDTFRITGDALITGTVRGKAAMMREEAAAERKDIYKALSEPNPSKETVEKAIGKLCSLNASVDAMIEKQKEAGNTRSEAIVKTFETLDTVLETLTENHQMICGYLKARRQIFGRPGSSVILPFKTFAETRDYLDQSIKNLEDQFKLAKELVEAAKEEFDEQKKRHNP